MGLDMYAFHTSFKPATDVDFDEDAVSDSKELHYWRKHPNLHGWMTRLYREKGGKAPDFNCVPLVITAADLNALQADIETNALPPTQGFFYGTSTGEERDDDLGFIVKARAMIALGHTVYYTSWW